MPTYEHQNTGTAADLLTYEKYIDANSGNEELSRVKTADQEWVVKETGGETFYIKFANNFSKKHFITGSKKQNAPANSVDLKIAKTLGHRAVANVCKCSHKFDKHPQQGGHCKTCGKTVCAIFETPYGKSREAKDKPKPYDPLAGQPTKKNTCIVLNLVPKADFENVVLKSILVHEKPPTWKQGDPLAKNVDDVVELEWDFRNLGAVVQANTTTPAHQWVKKKGCQIKAKKTAASGQGHTWEIFHMGNVI